MEFRKSENIIHRKIGDDYFLIDSSRDELHAFNETGNMIWELFIKGLSKTEIAHRLSKIYDIDSREAMKDVEEFIVKLKNKGIIE